MAHYTSAKQSHIGTRVFLDGVEVKDVTEANTDQGWFRRAVRGASGNFIVDRVRGEVVTKTVRGNVTAKTA